MANQKHDTRDTAARSGGRENVITSGGIETPVEGFHGNITTSAPFRSTYGNHKKMGSEMLPTEKGGRGGAKATIKKDLNKPAFRSRTMGKENA